MEKTDVKGIVNDEIKKFVNEMMAKILSDEQFKVKIANDLISQIIKQGFR